MAADGAFGLGGIVNPQPPALMLCYTINSGMRWGTGVWRGLSGRVVSRSWAVARLCSAPTNHPHRRKTLRYKVLSSKRQVRSAAPISRTLSPNMARSSLLMRPLFPLPLFLSARCYRRRATRSPTRLTKSPASPARPSPVALIVRSFVASTMRACTSRRTASALRTCPLFQKTMPYRSIPFPPKRSRSYAARRRCDMAAAQSVASSRSIMTASRP